MNQILITGEEKINQKVNTNVKKEIKEKKVRREKTVLPINGIVIFYSICIIILGICMISGSVYARDQINKTVESNKKPEISFYRNEDNTVSINVKHVRGIKTVTYCWNSESEENINVDNPKNVNETIDLPEGENTLKVTAIDENGKSITLQKVYLVEKTEEGNPPHIKILGAVDNGISIYASSDEGIDSIKYNWDNGEWQEVEIEEEQFEYTGIISAPQGMHTLKIVVVDIKGSDAKIEETIVGDLEPTLKVEPVIVNDKAAFSITAEDDENIKTIKIIHNGGEEQVIEVNEKTFNKNIIMTDGETNTLKVVVINKNNLESIKKVKFNNYY